MVKLRGPLISDVNIKRAAVQMRKEPAPGNLDGSNGVSLKENSAHRRVDCKKSRTRTKAKRSHSITK